MKYILLVISLFVYNNILAQHHSNTSNGIAVEGYDVVSYFNNSAQKGKKEFELKYKDAIYRFSSANNKTLFSNNPVKYIPQYGGWCAYAMGKTGEEVTVDPETFSIKNGKLYLFYNNFFNNTYDSWLKENPSLLIQSGDKNWAK